MWVIYKIKYGKTKYFKISGHAGTRSILSDVKYIKIVKYYYILRNIYSKY